MGYPDDEAPPDVLAKLPDRLQTIVSWSSILALLILAALAIRAVRDLREETQKQVHQGLKEQLEERVAMFEGSLLVELDGMLEAARSSDADLAALQALWRRTHPWFDALYVWEVDTESGVVPEVRFRHPAPRRRLDEGARRICERRAQRAAAVRPGDLPTLAAQYLVQCGDQRRDVRAWASAEAAQRLLLAGRPHDALDALAMPDLDDHAPLRTAPDVGPSGRVARRLLLADLLDEVGELQKAVHVRQSTVQEILALDAPDLETTLYLVPSLIEVIEASGRDVRLLRGEIPVAEQRLAAFREIRQAAARPSATRVTEGARFTYDQYSDTPYLLYSLRLDDESGGIALQLSQDELLDTFLASGARFQDALVVADVTGRAVAGARGAELSDITVPFRETLRHLRAMLTREHIVARSPSNSALTYAFSSFIAFSLMLGFGAIYAQNQANARQRLLLQRQRDFTARVTHELKTPLAGMRVMAENLLVGAFRDEHQRVMMAQRIVEEADRLTARVEEILQLARKHEVPDPEPFDLEEVLLELVDAWGPRYEQAGVRLLADIDATETILGDPRAVRDAIACLLDNALKYRREGVASCVWLNVRQDESVAELEVVDNGLGVPPDLRQAVFERFVRVEGPNRGKAGGHGLGLAHVAAIARAHKGSVRCEEGTSGGARFVLRLPTTGG